MNGVYEYLVNNICKSIYSTTTKKRREIELGDESYNTFLYLSN